MLVDSPSKRAHGNAASRLALGLVETGRVEVDLVCYSSDAPPPWLPPEVRIHRLGVERVSRSIPSLIRYLCSEQPDVLMIRQMHANFIGLAAGWMARMPPSWRGKIILVQDQLVETCHSMNRRDNKWMAKILYRFADGLIAPSPAVRDDAVHFCHLDSSSATVVPNPIPRFSETLDSPPHPWLEDGQPPVFVNIGNLLPIKRVDLTIEAFAELRKTRDARLLIVGEGPERSSAVDLIRRLGLEYCAATTGWSDDVQQFAARAWALVHSSDGEGFAQVLTEAMSAGCPVITTDAVGGGPAFVTNHGEYGILVPRGDRAKLTDAMVRMLEPDVRKQYSELGYQRAEELSPAASAGALVDFLTGHLRLAG